MSAPCRSKSSTMPVEGDGTPPLLGTLAQYFLKSAATLSAASFTAGMERRASWHRERRSDSTARSCTPGGDGPTEAATVLAGDLVAIMQGTGQQEGRGSERQNEFRKERGERARERSAEGKELLSRPAVIRTDLYAATADVLWRIVLCASRSLPFYLYVSPSLLFLSSSSPLLRWQWMHEKLINTIKI